MTWMLMAVFSAGLLVILTQRFGKNQLARRPAMSDNQRMSGAPSAVQGI